MTVAFKFLLRYCLLAGTTALLAYGLVAWHDRGMAIEGLLLYDNDWRPHPMHLLVLGICLLPMAMWEIFALDVKQQARRRQRRSASAAPEPAPSAPPRADIANATTEVG